ncbi:MAG: PAS domain S-box protein [Deltaproteobacteria bacterium]|nr:PAS domain S-box protein [Deltaproteobacteria bacterium]
MASDHIILQSAGSLSVGILAVVMVILQAVFFLRRPRFPWYAWSAAISFSALLYSIGIFLEYNTPAGPLNRFAGLLEFTAIIGLIHCVYGFTFAYIGTPARRYHWMAGICHGLILVLLWFTPWVVAHRFVTRHFITSTTPFTEPALGPLGPLFALYAATAGLVATMIWLRSGKTDPKHRTAYLAGIGFWLLLGIHDGLVSMGVSPFQYVMEYGFLGFAMAVLWVVFDNDLEIAAEEKYRLITEFANDCILIIQDGEVVFGNPACDELLGRPIPDAEPPAFLDLVDPEDRQTAVEHHRNLLKGGPEPKPHRIRIRRSDGERRSTEIASTLIRYRNRPAVLAVVRDVTEQEQAREALRRSEERLRMAGEVSYDLIYEWDVESDVLEWFGDVDELLGYPRGTISKDISAWLNIIHPEDKETLQEALNLHRTSNKPIHYEYRIRHQEGAYRYWKDHGHPLLDHQGRPYKWVGVCTDITDRKQAEEALLESDTKFRTLFDESPQAVAVTELESGKMVDVNRKFCEVTGYDKDELIGKTTTDMDFYSEGARTKFIQELRESGAVNGLALDFNIRHGAKVYSEAYARLIHISGKPHVLSMLVDITEQRRLESHLLHAQKMESIGRLAGGVAHDFNNMLSVILGRAEMALMGMKPEDQHYRYLQEIQKVAERSAELPRQLLAFARKQTIAPEVLYLNDTVEGMLKMLRRLIGEDIDFTWRPGTNLWLVEIDPSQIDQILANLCVNARDAVSGAGKITLETQNAALDKTFCETHAGAAPGEYVLLAVSDNGCGMDKDLQEKAFEPFFTTKDVGKGTGLGLSTVYGIVKQNNGFVYIYSEPMQGTTIKIYFPRYRGTSVKDTEKKIVEIPRGHGETVLLVEDNPDILEAGREMLEELAYRVTAAGGPEEALKWAGETPDRINLLMTDVIMPGMNGRELAEQITAARPETRILFMSGYTADAIAHHGVLEKGVHFLQKPFTLITLARKVRAVLDES